MMRTLIMLGIAGSALVAAEAAHAAETRLSTGLSITDSLVAAGHKQKRDAALDYGVGAPSDARVYSGGADRYPVEGEYRRVEDVDYQGRWTGTWNGTYETPDGRRYDGEYHGTYYGDAGTNYAPSPRGPAYGGPAYGYDPREDERMARLCRDDGLGGAAIGAVVGGVAGNRIAGRGDRLGGTLLGAGVGGLLGAAIDKGEDRAKCAAWRASRQRPAHGGYHPGSYPPAGYPGGYAPYPGGPQVVTHHQGGYGYGYGYYSPGVVVTTIITNAAPVVTTETVTTTTTHYETVSVPRKRYAPKKRYYKPRPKPRCTC
jgi:hypothetical protein